MALLAGLATALGNPLPLIGAPVIAIVLGVLLSPVPRRVRLLGPRIRFSGHTVLQVAVVVLGTQLSLRQVAEVGVSSLPVMVGTLVICLAAAYGIGRALKVDADLGTLIGVGTGICGASAIAAVTPISGRRTPRCPTPSPRSPLQRGRGSGVSAPPISVEPRPAPLRALRRNGRQ